MPKVIDRAISMEKSYICVLVFLKDEADEYAFYLSAEILAGHDSLVYELDLRFHDSSVT